MLKTISTKIKMKNLILFRAVCFFSFLFLTIPLYPQVLPISTSTGKVTYEDVITIDGLSASQIYVRGNEWFAKTFNSANDVIQMQDKEAHKIIGKGAISVVLRRANVGYFYYTISFYAKDGRFKYEITDIYHENINGSSGGDIINEKPECGTFSMMKSEWANIKSQANDNILALTMSLKNYFNETGKTQDDW